MKLSRKGSKRVEVRRIIGWLLSLVLIAMLGAVSTQAAEYQLDDEVALTDGYIPPEDTTIIHYLNSSAKPYTKIANRIEDLWVGEHHRFTVALNQRTKANIRWSSSNPEVAEIDAVTGELTALSVGTTTVTMRDSVNKAKQTCKVTVKAVPVLPEIPEEWYTTETYRFQEWWESGKGIRMIFKEEYRDLFEYCTILNIPFELNGLPVKSFALSSEPKKELTLAEIGFRNLKVIQYMQINDKHLYGLQLDELISWNRVFDQAAGGRKLRVHIPETAAVILDTIFAMAENGQRWVRIPAGVKVVGIMDAETDCNGIDRPIAENYAVDGNNTNYYSLFGVLFSYPFQAEGGNQYQYFIKFWSGENRLLSYPPEKSGSAYRVPDGVEVIEDYAFCHANNLKKVVLPDTVTSIMESAFYQCENITEIVIPASVVYLAEYCIYDHHEDLTIVTPKGSAAEAYAIEYGIKYRNE